MEVELEPNVKILGYKVKATSRESSPAQKAAHVLDTDLRNHWSTATNTKEWILLELDDPCLLSQIRIYNKSVLEWEISVGLSNKPDTFVKVRPRCEAPRRDMIYPMNYSPCRYVRVSCMRGNPISIFFIQLIGVPVMGLEPEFQPVVNYLLPNIISHKLDPADMHLQLLQDITNRLARFLPHIEADLNNFSEAAEISMRFIAVLAGPFYPILQIVNEREVARLAINVSDQEAFKVNSPSTSLTVSSNFEPRRSRNISSFHISSHLVFRPDAILTLLRKAYKDSNLGKLCRLASRILMKLSESVTARETSIFTSDLIPTVPEPSTLVSVADYSKLFGEEFQIPDDNWDSTYFNLLDSEAVEEGILHVLYASASQPLLCSKLADSTSDFCLALPLIQALLPALRPIINTPYQIDYSFSLWKQSFVQNALSQIVATSSSLMYRPLLHACVGYLSSFLPSHVKAACVLIDLCSGVLAPCIAQIIAKVDLTLELLEDLLGVIQGARSSLSRARAAIKYIVLALSGNMDDVMTNYKDSKHRILFLMEILEPFLDPAFANLKGMVAFGNVASVFLENQEQNCAIALNVIHIAIRKSALLPSLETEWRRGSVAPSVLLAILDSQMQLPPDIDNRKFSALEMQDPRLPSTLPTASRNGLASSKLNSLDNGDGKVDDSGINGKADVPEDISFLFAPLEVNRMCLTYFPACKETKMSDSSDLNVCSEVNNVGQKNICNQSFNDLALTSGQGLELHNFLANYSQLMNYRDCELRASEFRRLALDLLSQNEVSLEGHDAAIDALLLAAECYINPCFTKPFENISVDFSNIYSKTTSEKQGIADIKRVILPKNNDLKIVADIEKKRDRVVLEILIEAALLDRKQNKVALEQEICASEFEEEDNVVNLNQEDIFYADAITLIRKNQALLCTFLIKRLHRNFDGEQHSMHEILIWCLLFLLHSATKLFCSPEYVVDIILNYAKAFQERLKLFDHKTRGNSQLKRSNLHEVQCRWILLHKLVIASSGNDERLAMSLNSRSGFRLSNLIPPSTWLQKVPIFSSSTFPLVRYFGWMAVSRNAKQYLKEQIFLVSDFSQLMYLLSIFSDDLALVDSITEPKGKIEQIEGFGDVHPVKDMEDGDRSIEYSNGMQSFHVLYPDVSKFFPSLKKEFVAFGETILEAVGLQLKFLSSTIVPDLVCWFSDLCLWPFVKSEKSLVQCKFDNFKGFAAKNAKAVILYVLEAIVVGHMEAMVPETPRVVKVLESLCRTSYCDVSFLDSVLRILKPIIGYSLSKVSGEENLLIDGTHNNFESLCFSELYNNVRRGAENEGAPKEAGKCQALTIFVLANIFGDLSFHWKTELLQSAILWADFTSFVGTTSFHDYICAYQVLMENCKNLLIGTLRAWDIIPLKMSPISDSTFDSCDGFSVSSSWFLSDICSPSSPTALSENNQDNTSADADLSQKSVQLSLEEIKGIAKDLISLISKLSLAIEKCWKIHHKLAKNLAVISAECLMYSRCLCLVVERVSASSEVEKLLPTNFIDESVDFWRTSLEGLSGMVLVLQDSCCWDVASVFLESLLGVPPFFSLDNVICDICMSMKNFSDSAPNISLRLQTDKMISTLVARGIHNLCKTEGHQGLGDMFCAMLGHPEPEQRYIALKHLGRLVGQDVDDGKWILPSTTKTSMTSSNSTLSSSGPILCALVSITWDQVAWVSSCDTSLFLRTHATALLISYIPYVERSKLQSFLAAADSILQCLTTLGQPACYGPLTQFSLALVASICLFSPAEDISLIPESIWRNVESFGISGNGRYCTDLEKKACEALLKLKEDGDQAKEILKDVLSLSSPKEIPDFVTTRESILQVIGNLSLTRAYFDFFSKEVEQKTVELEEAEMEMELIQTENHVLNSYTDLPDWRQLPFLSTYAKDDQRLQQIKDKIKSLDKAKLRQNIASRRQHKLLIRHARQQVLEEAALRESELIQQLERERTLEAEKELERQRLLELERAKTRELQHNLDIEKEKLAQIELQRELEQVETGFRSSRREFASSSHSRPRDKYRERDNGRGGGNEGSLRTGARTLHQENVAANSSMANQNQPTLVLSGTRSMSGQVPTILQSRDRSDECGSSHEDSFDGRSKDSGDTGSVGEPDLFSVLDGQPPGFGSGQRHGSRNSKSRQIIERRERDSRREGKWERKH